MRIIWLVCFAVKRAYYKVAMKVHPDKVPEKEVKAATVKFQVAGKAYAVLSDAQKRKLYDETGKKGGWIHIYR